MFEGMIVRPRCVNGFFKATIPEFNWRCRHRHRHVMHAHLCGWLKYRDVHPVKLYSDLENPHNKGKSLYKMADWDPLEPDEEEALIKGCPVFLMFKFCGGGHEHITKQEFKVLFAHAKVCGRCTKEIRHSAPGVSLMDLIILTQMENN